MHYILIILGLLIVIPLGLGLLAILGVATLCLLGGMASNRSGRDYE